MSQYLKTVNSASKGPTYNYSTTERFASQQRRTPEEEPIKKVSYRQKGRKYDG